MNQEMKSKRSTRNEVDYSNEIFKNFQCIGPDCKITCCSNWIISIDKETHDLYKASQDSFLTDNLVYRGDDDIITKRNSDMKVCNFLDNEDKFCSIQKKYGEDYLSNTCATYPRLFKTNKDSRLGAVSSSCHGAVKLILKAKPEDFAFKLENKKKNNQKINNSIKIHEKIINIINEKDTLSNKMLLKIYRIAQELDKSNSKSSFSMTNFTINNACENLESKMQNQNGDTNVENSLKNAIDIAYYMINESVNKKFEFLSFLKIVKQHFPYNEVNEKKKKESFDKWINEYNKNIEKIEEVANKYIRTVVSEELFPVYRTQNFAQFIIILAYEVIIFKSITLSLILNGMFDDDNVAFAMAAIRRHFYGNRESKLIEQIKEQRGVDGIEDLFFTI